LDVGVPADFDGSALDDGGSVQGTIGMLGGTGPMGRGLALRLAAAGVDVVVGSRDDARAAAVVAELGEQHPRIADRLSGAANADAATAGDVVVLAAPWEPAINLAASLADRLEDRTVVCVANALTRAGGAFLPLTMPRGSVTAEVQARLPASRVTGAFHHLPAGPLADLDRALDADVLVVGDDAGGRAATLDLVDAIEGLRGIDAGGLGAAGPVEAMTAVLVGINVGYRTHTAIRLTGGLDKPGPARAGN
jgi:NADPH-dependent F420 reductase